MTQSFTPEDIRKINNILTDKLGSDAIKLGQPFIDFLASFIANATTNASIAQLGATGNLAAISILGGCLAGAATLSGGAFVAGTTLNAMSLIHTLNKMNDTEFEQVVRTAVENALRGDEEAQYLMADEINKENLIAAIKPSLRNLFKNWAKGTGVATAVFAGLTYGSMGVEALAAGSSAGLIAGLFIVGLAAGSGFFFGLRAAGIRLSFKYLPAVGSGISSVVLYNLFLAGKAAPSPLIAEAALNATKAGAFSGTCATVGRALPELPRYARSVGNSISSWWHGSKKVVLANTESATKEEQHAIQISDSNNKSATL